jgi:hypothetical protein
MTLYRFYSIDKDGHVFARAELDCNDDQEALEFAKAMQTPRLEIWDHDRRVGIVSADDN